MKRTILAVLSITLMLLAFTACRQSVMPYPIPTPGNPGKPSEPTTVPEDSFESAIENAAADSEINLAGTYDLSNLTASFSIDKNLSFIGVKDSEIKLGGTISDQGYVTVPAGVKVGFENVDIVMAEGADHHGVYVYGNEFSFKNGILKGNGTAVFGIALTNSAQKAVIDNVGFDNFVDAGINVSIPDVTIMNCYGSSPILVDIGYNPSTMKIENNSCPIWIYPSATEEQLADLRTKNPESPQIIVITKTPSGGGTVSTGSDLSTNVSGTQPATMFLEEGEYSISSAMTMAAGSNVIGKKGSIIKSSDEITAGSSTANSPVTLQNLNIEFSHSTADTRVIDAFSPIHFEGGSVTTSGSTKTTIAVALNNSTAGSVIKDVNFSGMVCAVNISTPDFTLDNCVAEEGSKFYLDVMYVDGQSNFIDCLGLLEIYEPNTTSDESEQQAIIAKIHETSPRLVVKFVDA